MILSTLLYILKKKYSVSQREKYRKRKDEKNWTDTYSFKLVDVFKLKSTCVHIFFNNKKRDIFEVFRWL